MKKVTTNDIKKMKELTGINYASKQYFFQKADKRWLQPLHKEKYFNFETMSAVRDNEGYLLPELSYLERMTKEASDKVTEIILSQTMPKDCNPAFIERLFHMCSQMPAEHVSTLVGKILEERWIEKILQREDVLGSSLIPIGATLKNLREDKYYKELFACFNAATKSVLRTGDSLQINMETFKYLSDPVFDKSEREESRYLKFLINFLSDAVKNNPNIFKYFSSWSTSEGFGLQHKILRRLNNLLIEYSSNLSVSQDEIRSMYSKCVNPSISNNPLFFRFNFFILALQKKTFKKEIKEMLLSAIEKENHVFFSDNDFIVDFEFMVSSHLGLFSQDEKDRYINAIRDIMTKKKEGVSDDKQIKIGSRLFSLIWKYHDLTDVQQKKIQDDGFSLFKREEVNLQYDFPIGKIKSGFVDEKSPVTFQHYTVKEIIKKLQEELHPKKIQASDYSDEVWDGETGFFIRKGAEGIGNELKIDMGRKFSEYMQHAEDFFDRKKMPAFYTHSFLTGFFNFAKNNKEKVQDDTLLSILNLCIAIAESGKKEEFIDKKSSGWNDEVNHYWGEVHKEMCIVLGVLIGYCNKKFFSKNRSDIFDVVQYLLSHKQPTIEDESPRTAIMSAADHERGEHVVASPLSIAINTVRGSAFRLFINFMCKNHTLSKEISADIKEAFEGLLWKEKTKSIWFMLGHYLAYLYDRDKEWTIEILSKIFPKERKDFYLVAWEGYLSQTVLKKMFFDTHLQKIYEENIKTEKIQRRDMEYIVDPADRLGQHIALASIHFPEFDFSHDLFKSFFKGASISAKKGFASFIGSFIFENRINEVNNRKQVINRIDEIWDYLIDSGDVELLKETGSWLRMSEKGDILEPKAFIEKVLNTLRKTGGEINDNNLFAYHCSDTLLKLADTDPKEVFEVVELYLLNNKILYLTDELVNIFKKLQKSIKPEKFDGLISKLLQKNQQVFSRLGDLKSKKVK